MEYRIAPMTTSHLDQVAEIEKACFPDPWSRKILEETLAEPNTTNLAALDPAGSVLGYVSFTFILDEGGINNIAVCPSCRRQGIASSLLAAVRRAAEERRLAFLTLEVRASNQAARTLYAVHGYQEAGRRKNYYLHPREDAIIMTLEFTDGTENADPGGTEDHL